MKLASLCLIGICLARISSASEIPVTVQKSGTNVVITLPASAYDTAFEILGVTNNAQKVNAIKNITIRGIESTKAQARMKVESQVRKADINKLKAIIDAAQ